MKNHDILQILSSFTKEELSEFEKFVNSPYFNNQSTLIRLFDVLKHEYPDFTKSKLTDEIVFSKINRSKKYDDVLYRKYLSGLTKLAEEFLILKIYETSKLNKSITLLNAYYRKRLIKRFNKALANIEANLDPVNNISDIEFIDRHFLEEVKINFDIVNESEEKNNKSLFDAQQYLLNYLMYITANNITELGARTQNVNDESNIINSFISNFDFKQFITENESDNGEMMSFKLNYYGIMLLKDPDNETYYQKIKEIVFKNADNMSGNSIYMNITRLNNYCTHKIKKGYKEYEKEYLENSKFALNNLKYISKISRHMNFMTFKKLIELSLTYNDLQFNAWIQKNLINFIENDKRECAKCFADACMNIYKGEYRKAIENISRIRRSKTVPMIESDLMLSIAYYELDYFDSCFSIQKSMASLLNRNKKINQYEKEEFNNYIKYYKYITEAKSGTSDTNVKKLVSDIKNNNTMKAHLWMINKSEELEKRKN